MDNQTPFPNQNNQNEPDQTPNIISPAPLSEHNESVAAPSPEWINTTPVPPSVSDGKKSRSSMFGRLSLILSLLAVSAALISIFVADIVFQALTEGPAEIYIWFSLVAVLGVSGFVLGVLSLKKTSTLNLPGLLGLIISTIVCLNCLVIGSYYVKFEMAMNKLESDITDTIEMEAQSGPKSIDMNLDSDLQ